MNHLNKKLFVSLFENRLASLTQFRAFHQANPNITYEPAELGKNFQPKEFSQAEIIKTIDPKAMVQKEPSYEYKDIPRDGEDVNETHIMHFMPAFPNVDNDIGKDPNFNQPDDIDPNDPRIPNLDKILFSPSETTRTSLSRFPQQTYVEPPTMGKDHIGQISPSSTEQLKYQMHVHKNQVISGNEVIFRTFDENESNQNQLDDQSSMTNSDEKQNLRLELAKNMAYQSKSNLVGQQIFAASYQNNIFGRNQSQDTTNTTAFGNHRQISQNTFERPHSQQNHAEELSQNIFKSSSDRNPLQSNSISRKTSQDDVRLMQQIMHEKQIMNQQATTPRIQLNHECPSLDVSTNRLQRNSMFNIDVNSRNISKHEKSQDNYKQKYIQQKSQIKRERLEFASLSRNLLNQIDDMTKEKESLISENEKYQYSVLYQNQKSSLQTPRSKFISEDKRHFQLQQAQVKLNMLQLKRDFEDLKNYSVEQIKFNQQQTEFEMRTILLQLNPDSLDSVNLNQEFIKHQELNILNFGLNLSDASQKKPSTRYENRNDDHETMITDQNLVTQQSLEEEKYSQNRQRATSMINQNFTVHLKSAEKSQIDDTKRTYKKQISLLRESRDIRKLENESMNRQRVKGAKRMNSQAPLSINSSRNFLQNDLARPRVSDLRLKNVDDLFKRASEDLDQIHQDIDFQLDEANRTLTFNELKQKLLEEQSDKANLIKKLEDSQNLYSSLTNQYNDLRFKFMKVNKEQEVLMQELSILRREQDFPNESFTFNRKTNPKERERQLLTIQQEINSGNYPLQQILDFIMISMKKCEQDCLTNELESIKSLRNSYEQNQLQLSHQNLESMINQSIQVQQNYIKSEILNNKADVIELEKKVLHEKRQKFMLTIASILVIFISYLFLIVYPRSNC
eukprot:403371318